MSFSFGFSGDDVGDDHDLVAENGNTFTFTNPGPESQFVGLPAEQHALGDLVGNHIFLIVFISRACCNEFSILGLTIRSKHIEQAIISGCFFPTKAFTEIDALKQRNDKLTSSRRYSNQTHKYT